jgi:hypothetical protein
MVGMDGHENPTGLIRRRREAIKREIAALRMEDAELEAVELSVQKAVARLLGNQAEAPPPPAPAHHYHVKPETGRYAAVAGKPKTTKEIIVDYLGRTPSTWRTANDIQAHVSEIKAAMVPMGSISPTLTELKNDGIVVRDNLRVALAERVRRETPDFFKENGPSEGEPKGGPDTGGDAAQH